MNEQITCGNAKIKKITSEKYLIEISITNYNKISLFLVAALGIFSFMFPFFILFVAIRYHIQVKFGFALTVIMYGLIFVYFSKLYLWNKHGKEIYIIDYETKTFSYYFDYKYFKSKSVNLHFSTLKINYYTDNECKKDTKSKNAPPMFCTG